MRKLHILLLAVLLVTAGCAEMRQQLQAQRPAAQPVAAASDAATWLEAYNATRSLTPEQQQQTLASWEQHYQDYPDTAIRVQLALLLSTGADSLRDLQRARRILNSIDPLPTALADREFIALLQQWLDDQTQAGRKLDILWKQVTDQNRRIEELEQQLQALTNIEQNIQNRDTVPGNTK